MSVIDEIIKGFSPSSKETWTKLFLKESKQESLQTNVSILGFDFLPFYTSTDNFKSQTTLIASLMAKKGAGWNINTEFSTNDPLKQNKLILASLESGVSSITLKGDIKDLAHLSALLKDVLANYIEINFDQVTDPLTLAKIYKEWCDANNHDTKLVFGNIFYDPIGNALKNGKWNSSKEKDLELLLNTSIFVSLTFEKLNCISIDAGAYHYSGANLKQTLAYTLSHALEYLNYFNANKIPLNKVIDHISFVWPVGINFFGEMAALRSLYICWNDLAQHITGAKDLFAANIFAQTSVFYWSGSDKHNNLLRSATQTMAAVAGGANAVNVSAFTELNDATDISAQRLATNVQLLLREESFLDKVIDPAGGSFFVESLTDQLAGNTFTLLKKLETEGGFLAAAENGSIQNDIKANASLLIEAYKTGKIKILGSNIFPNPKESGKLTRKNYFETKKKVDVEPLSRFVLDTN